MKVAGSHDIFCLLRPDKPTLLLVILHERMDLMARMKGRLCDGAGQGGRSRDPGLRTRRAVTACISGSPPT
jgi:hypothetical protein